MSLTPTILRDTLHRLRLEKRGLVLTCLLIANLAASSAVAQQVNYVPRGNKDFHTVQRGDTLYDLSGRYTGDVYNWPQVWSYNPHITNPHWIYPGDIVYLKPAGPGGGDGPTRVGSSGSGAGSELYMAVGGFIAKDELKYEGRIVASPKQAEMLSELDTAWVGFGDRAYTEKEKEDIKEEDRETLNNSDKEVSVGDVYAIVRPMGEIVDPDDDERVLGHKYLVVGSLHVTEVSDKYLSTAEIDQSWEDIHRGDMLVPYEQQLKRVQIIQSEQNLVGKIVDTVHPRSALGEFHYVYVNKGAEDNVRVGNRFYVFQRREGLQRLNEEADEEIPWERVGQVLLIDVRENYSTAVIIDSKRPLLVGDRLEMYEGY